MATDVSVANRPVNIDSCAGQVTGQVVLGLISDVGRIRSVGEKVPFQQCFATIGATFIRFGLIMLLLGNVVVG